MNRQRNGTSTSGQGYLKQLLHAIVRFLPRRGLPLQTKDGRVRWSDRLLAMTAVLMVWSGRPVTLDAFREAREVVVSMYKTRRRPGRCLSGFLTRLRRSTARLLTVLVPTLRKATQEAAGKRWQWRQWILMAVDGSRVNPNISHKMRIFCLRDGLTVCRNRSYKNSESTTERPPR